MNRFGKPNADPSQEDPANDAAAPRAPARVIDIDDTMIGRPFHHFTVRARLGHSSMGTVFLADDTSLLQPVMLTVLRKGPAAEAGPAGDVLAAPRQQARVAHENVAQVRFVGVAEGNPYVVAEHVDGLSLRDEIKHSGAIPWPDAVAYLVQIVRGLQAAQELGMSHGALSPSNIVLRRHGEGSGSVEVKVDGFGMPAPLDGERPSPYLSPEQVAGGPASVRGDMFALGVIFHEMLTAAPPRPERALPEPLAPHYIRRLVAFLKREDPKQRPSGYEELLGRLEVALVEPPAAQPLVARAAAFCIDMAMMAFITIAAGVVLPRFAPASRWESMQLGMVFFACYSAFAYKNGGQSLGKQICGVILLEPRHGLNWPRLVARVLIKLWGPFAAAAIIDIQLGFLAKPSQMVSQLGGTLVVIGLLWLVGFLVVLTDKKGIALHDHVAGTSVVSS